MWLTGSVSKGRPNFACTCAITQSPIQQGPDISRLSLKLQQQWHHEKNAHLGNIVIKRHTHRIVSWRCSECPDGHCHEWEAPVCNRTTNDGCPFCTSRRVCKHNSLANQAPDIAAAWDVEANARMPSDYTVQSRYQAQWLCLTCKHKWSAKIQVRAMGSGCPQCFRKRRHLKRVTHPTFAACNHPLLGDWDHEANVEDGLHPNKIRLHSHKHVHWICHKCPRGCLHRYQATPAARIANGTGCPYCSGHKACKCNSLQSLLPDIACEWDYERNEGSPDGDASRAVAVVWWKSAKRGSWQQSIHSRTQNKLKKHQ